VSADERCLVRELREAPGELGGFVVAHQLKAVHVRVQIFWRCGGPVHHLKMIDRLPPVAWINGWIC